MKGFVLPAPQPRNETCLVIGASSGLGRCLAERFAAAGYALAMVSSDLRDIDAVASDLQLRFGVPTATLALDLRSALVDMAAIDAMLNPLPPLTTVLAAAGSNDENDTPDQPAERLAAISRANFSNICAIIAHTLPDLTSAPAGLVAGFGSVAAVRGRTRNAAYSAAKRALQSYFESLRHALAGSHVSVHFYVLGYLDTNLAFGQATLLPRAAPRRLADRVFRRRAAGSSVQYYPRVWWAICAAVRLVPWFIYRRLKV